MPHVPLLSCVRLVLYIFSRYRLIKRRSVKKDPLNAFHRMAGALWGHVLRLSNVHQMNYCEKGDATVHPSASPHGSVGVWFSVNAVEGEDSDPCRNSGMVGTCSSMK